MMISKKVKLNTVRLLIFLSLSSLSCEASAHWQDSLIIYLTNASCTRVTKQTDSLNAVEVQQDSHGLYELTAKAPASNQINRSAYKSSPTPTVYNCYTNGSALTVPIIQGTFANLDPTSFFDPVYGGIGMSITTINGSKNYPCYSNLSIAPVYHDGYEWCSGITNPSTSGGKNGWNAWEIDDPSLFTFGNDWQMILLQEREFTLSWGVWNDGTAIELIHQTN